MTVALSSLCEPPVIGRRYVVPVVTATFFGKLDEWPVRGPRHSDQEYFGFRHQHYHIDPRFLTGRQVAYLQRQSFRQSAQGIAEAYPLTGGWNGGAECGPLPHAKLLERRCAREASPYENGQAVAVRQLNEALAGPAIRSADGRLLCPHRKYDLSTIPVGADGFVVCPLHGLRVDCRVAA